MYKIYTKILCWPQRHIPKFLRIMKLTALLLFAIIMQVSATTLAQKVTLKENHITLKKLFREIRQQTGYDVLYQQDQVNTDRTLNVDFKDASLNEVMEKSLSGQPLEFNIDEKTIVIKQKEPTLLDKLKNALTPNPPPSEITGRVTNKQGEPLSGATILLKRTKSGTIADANGTFKLSNVNENDTLFVSFLGYKTLMEPVGKRTTFNIILEETSNGLDQVVIQGYGKTSQRLATGDIGRVTSAEIERQPVMNPLLALQGKVAGLDITQTSGYASAPIKVELRGRSAINSNFPADPLYIIDGVPLTVMEVAGFDSYSQGSPGFIQNGLGGPANGQSPLFSVNPSDIESIEVLKDADATAIYGSRGGNGVILITTKKGKAGKTKLDLHIQEGISDQTRFYDLLNTQQYLQIRNQAFKNDNIVPTAGNAYDLLTWNTSRYTDWQKVLYGGTGRNTDVQAAISGGNALTTFRIGTSFNNSTDILTSSGGDKRASLSFSLSHHSNDQKFELSLSTMYGYTYSNLISLPSNILLPPNAPSIYNADGNLNWSEWEPYGTNPFSSLLQPYTSTTNFLNSDLTIAYHPAKGLSLSANIGYSNAQNSQVSLTPIASQDPASDPTGMATFGNNSNKNWIVEPQITYDAILGKGKISVLAGASLQQTNTDGLAVTGFGYTSDDLLRTISNAPQQVATDNSGEYRYAALFARVSYNWQDEFLLNFNGRRDGSSNFGSGSQYGNFGSVGAAWIFTQEHWFKENLSFLSFGKIRGSYGTSGSDAGSPYAYLSRWSSNGLSPYDGISSLASLQHTNPNYQWQVNKKLEEALDLGFFKDRVTLSIDYYRNRTGNQLIQFPTPILSGFTTVLENSPALVQNDGWEFTANAKIIQGKDFSWSTSLITSINHNKLVSYPDFSQSPYIGIYQIGQPLNIAYALHYTGVDPLTGQYTVKDKNGDGVISTTKGPTDDRYIVNLTPKFSGGVGMNFSYKSLTLNLYFVVKDQIGVNALAQGHAPGSIFNQPVQLLGTYWQQPGQIASTARLTTQPNNTETYYLESDAGYTDASFIRLSNLSLSYNLPAVWAKKAGLSGCSLFFHTNNLFTITKYKGIDPETQNFGGLPPSKILVFGLSLNF
ncbi:MAG: SusC/RagA family TonB-linked outer membrane protein [Mucilaginibacter sp.]|nr:SusC/RagA family TonB-linked outer membrane protein [Mucilaginibacter sp.]